VAFVIWLLFSDRFMVKSLAVEANDKALADRVTKVITAEMKESYYLVSGANQFLWTDSKINRLFDKEFPGIKGHEARVVDNELFISIDQYSVYAIWCPQQVNNITMKNLTTSGCLAINNNGEVFKSDFSLVSDSNFSELLIFSDKYTAPESGEQILLPETISLLNSYRKELEDRDYKITRILLTDNTVDIKLETIGGDTLPIDLVVLPKKPESLSLSLKDFLLVIDENELSAIADREEIARYSQVDLTSPNKLFYRFVKKQ